MADQIKQIFGAEWFGNILKTAFMAAVGLAFAVVSNYIKEEKASDADAKKERAAIKAVVEQNRVDILVMTTDREAVGREIRSKADQAFEAITILIANDKDKERRLSVLESTVERNMSEWERRGGAFDHRLTEVERALK